MSANDAAPAERDATLRDTRPLRRDASEYVVLPNQASCSGAGYDKAPAPESLTPHGNGDHPAPRGSVLTPELPFDVDVTALLEAAPDGIAVVDEDGTIVHANARLCSIVGYVSREILGRPVEVLIPGRLRGIHTRRRGHYQESPVTRPMGVGLSLVARRKDGTDAPVEISLSPFVSGGRTLTIAIVRDIAEQSRLRAERETLERLIEAERERHRIGMDLHDGVMQDVFAVGLGLELALDEVDSHPDETRAAISSAIDNLHNVVLSIRSYIFDLRPREFQGKLGPALVDLGQEFERNSGVHTTVTLAGDLPEVPDEVGVAFYVLSHEALSNIRKYAEAATVAIVLDHSDGRLLLSITDDGQGFDTSIEMSQSHRGLRNMHSRARSAGLDLAINSEPGAGTSVVASYQYLVA